MSAVTSSSAPKKRTSNLERLRTVWMALDYVVLILLALFFLFPLVLMVVSSFKNDETQVLRDLSDARAFIPYGDLGVQNYLDVFTRASFALAAFNSFLTVGLTVALGLVVNSTFAYALARLRFVGRGWLLGAVVASIIVPFQATAIPLLLLVNQFGWLNSYHVQIIPFIASAFSIYLFYQFFIDFPVELEEAAIVDGATRWQVFWRIVAPNSWPVFATVAILSFLGRWSDLLWPVMVVRGERFAPLPLAMQTFFGQSRQWGDIMAYATLVTLPTLVLFLGFQRWFVRSIVSSGVKG
jgi:multiple sugar transport system permease protein